MKKCAFCSNPADSREHIFSDWMVRMLPAGERYRFTELIPEQGEHVQYQGPRVQLRAKAVCTSCNNEWMSDLENQYLKPAMQHLLFGNPEIILTVKETVRIAAFAFKTLIVANHKDLTTTPFFPSSLRSRFRLELRIPEGIQVWMANRTSAAGKYYGFWKSAYGKSEQKSIYGFSNYICTWNFQNVVLQVLASKWLNKWRRETIPFPMFPQREEWKDASVRIWPHDGSEIQWPPRCYLGDDTIDVFRDRWNTIGLVVR